MDRPTKRLEQTLDPDSPWGRLIRAMADTNGGAIHVSRPPKVLRYPGLKVQDSSLGRRRTWQAEFPWEGKRWLDLLAAQELPTETPVRVTGYLSESPEMRQMLALQGLELLRVKGLGAQVTVRSSYKTGLFWVKEEVLPRLRRVGADGLRLVYPVADEAPAWRFLQETFPLSSLLEEQNIAFESQPRDDGIMGYTAVALQNNQPLWQTDCPLPLHRRAIVGGGSVWTTTGQLRIEAGNHKVEERIVTDGEQFWDWFMEVILPELLKLTEGKNAGPFFRNLTVAAQLSEPEVPLGIAQECASMPEALSEEVYFTTLEAFKEQQHIALQGRGLTIGRIVPVMRALPGQNGRAKVVLIENGPPETEPHEPINAQTHLEPHRVVLHSSHKALDSLRELEAAQTLPAWERTLPRDANQLPAVEIGSPTNLPSRPLRPREIWQAAYSLSQNLGLNLDVPAYSYDGRPILALSRDYKPGKPGLLITGGQHANEQTGPKAALQLTELLAVQDQLNWVVLPLENPDGNKLHHALMQLAPHHMHHPARYTSLGDDLQARMHHAKPRWEAAGRHWALEAFRPRVHLNLHGYPSHEWARPYSGYSPRGFEAWALPMGVLMVLHYSPAQKDAALNLGEKIAAALDQRTPLRALTDAALKRREAHSHDQPYVVIGGFPFILWEREMARDVIEVITEMPDETVYGREFELLVEGQIIVGKTILEWLKQG